MGSSAMKEEVLHFIHKNQLLTKNSTVLAGTSGGPDSLALLHFLHSIQEEWELDVICVSVDHRLRGEESRSDLEYVEAICKEWNIPFAGTSIDVPAYQREKNISEEVAARELRYRYFKEQMEKLQADYLALGHHGDDQVETMIMSLARTASSSAFAGIPITRPFSVGHIIRPFLCVTKDDILSYCKNEGLTPRIDQTNFETRYTRNYYRKHVVPLLKKKNNNIHNTIGHLSKTMEEDEQFMQQEAEKVVQETAQLNVKQRTCILEINRFIRRPLALQRRAFHLILNYLYDKKPSDLSYIHEEHFFSLLKYNKGQTSIDFPFRLKLEKSYDKLRFYFPHQHQAANDSSFFKSLNIPGETVLPDGSCLSAKFVEQAQHDDLHTFTFHADHAKLPLSVRTRKPGDRMTWKGLNGSKKIKDLFIDYKIPVRERDRWPIIVDNGGKILWIVGLKKNYPNIRPDKGMFIQLNYEKREL